MHLLVQSVVFDRQYEAEEDRWKHQKIAVQVNFEPFLSERVFLGWDRRRGSTYNLETSLNKKSSGSKRIAYIESIRILNQPTALYPICGQ